MGYFVVGGKQYEVPFDVRHDPKRTFKLGDRGLFVREEKPDSIVFHDTAGEGSARTTFGTLKRKGYPVELCGDRNGVCWQFIPDLLLYRGQHVNRFVSPRSIGMEFTNAVAPGHVEKPWQWMMRMLSTGREKLYGRPTAVDTYRGKKRQVLGHFPKQIELAYLIAFHLPRIITSIVRLWPGYPGKISGDRVPHRTAGILGHLHWTDKHVDPALDLFDMIRDRGLE